MEQGLPDWLEVTNIKLSLKIPGFRRMVDIVERCAKSNQFTYKALNSFVVLKFHHSSCRFIVFQSKKGVASHHINLTGVKNRQEIDSCLEALGQLFNVLPREMTVNIDNVTCKATCLEDFLKEKSVESINLYTLMNQLKIDYRDYDVICRFQPHVYSALIVKLHGTTSLVYEKGTILVIGAKSTGMSTMAIQSLFESACRVITKIQPSSISPEVMKYAPAVVLW